MTTLDVLLWVVLPYVTIAVFVAGTVWRFRYDKFGWTTRSSQLYERSLLRIASPLFHIGILAVVVGHVVGLLIPEDWTERGSGSARTPTTSSRSASVRSPGLHPVRRRDAHLPPPHHRPGLHGHHQQRQDDVRVPRGGHLPGPHHDDRRRRASSATATTTARPCRRGSGRSSCCNPQPELMAESLPSFQIHAVAGMLLFIIWPFTRLVHAFSAPFGYLFRPYVVYRDRGPHDAGSHAPKRGWEKVG